MKPGSTKLMRKINIGLLRSIMIEKKIFKKAELANASGLSVVTINSLLVELIEIGEVLETDKVATTGGRKAVLYKYNPNYKLVLVICLFEQNNQEVACISVCNLYGENIINKQYNFENISNSQLEGLIAKYLDRYANISLITIGIPGQESNGSLKIMDFKSLDYESLFHKLQKKFQLPILIENDINLAIYGYSVDHNEENKSIVGIYYPVKHPPGAGVIIDGKLLKGRNGMAGEIKYLPLGINWDSFSYKEIELKQHAIKTAVAIESLYAPDKYVFFGNIFNHSFIQEIKMKLNIWFPNIKEPIIVFESNFHNYYLKGAIVLSLDYLNKENNI